MSEEAARQIGNVAMLSLTFASTSMLVQAAGSMAKGSERKMRSLNAKAFKVKPLEIPEIRLGNPCPRRRKRRR